MMRSRLLKLPLKVILLGTLFWLVRNPALAHSGHEGAFLHSLTERSLTPTLTLTGIGIAFLFGAGHALAPGHGKTMVAAYLVGSRGTPQQAFLLGCITTIAHTCGVFALGLLALFASQYVLPEQLYPVLTFLSGLTICGVGFWLLEDYLTQSADHPEHHHHLPTEPLSGQSLITLGVAGGLVPCPSALVLLLSAIAIHREAYGMILLGSFSLGLASVLIAIGLTAVYAYQWLERLPSGRITQHIPIASALVVIVAGLIVTAGAVI